MANPTTQPPLARIADVDATLVRPGGLSYLEIPAVDPDKSATFYKNVVGWHISTNAAGEPRFCDPAGLLIGRWIVGRAIAHVPGILPYICIGNIQDAMAQVAVSGGEVVEPPRVEGSLLVATVRDPAGNVIGLWQVRAG